MKYARKIKKKNLLRKAEFFVDNVIPLPCTSLRLFPYQFFYYFYTYKILQLITHHHDKVMLSIYQKKIIIGKNVWYSEEPDKHMVDTLYRWLRSWLLNLIVTWIFGKNNRDGILIVEMGKISLTYFFIPKFNRQSNLHIF